MVADGVGLLLVTAFAKTFGDAAGFYSLRAAFNQGTAGARQVVVAAELTRRGPAASLQSLPLQIPRAAGPVLGGWLMRGGRLVEPFVVATALQGINLLLYKRYVLALDEIREPTPHTQSSEMHREPRVPLPTRGPGSGGRRVSADRKKSPSRQTTQTRNPALVVRIFLLCPELARDTYATESGQPPCTTDRVRLGRIIFAIFLTLQIADGLMTFGAVRIFGDGVEANPILATWIQLAGPGITLLAAKTVACGLAVVLYRTGHEKTLAALTGLLLCGAVAPWLALLAAVPG